VAVFHGTKHDDSFNESSDTASDTFDLAKGGEDTATGGSGDDVFNMGASLDAGDRLDGGAGRDVVNIHGDYSAGLVFDDQTIQNIEVLRLGAGFDYSLTMANGNVASGAYLTIDASALGRANHLTFDGSLESDGHYLITDGAGDDVLTGGALADKFRLMNGGTDTVHGGGGDDVIVVTAGSPTGDTIDGGTGNDTLTLGGHSGSVTLDGSDNVTGIETLSFHAGNSYAVTVVSDITDGGGKTLTVDGSALGASDTMTLDLSGATSAAYAIHGGAGGDTVTFGSNFANANGGFGTTDTIDGGAGSDTLVFTGGMGVTGIGIAPPLDMGSGTLTSVETIEIQGADDFNLRIENGNIAAGATLTVDSTGATGKVAFDASLVTDGNLHFIAGTGQTEFIGSANADVFDLTQAANADGQGGDGNDVFNLAGSLAGMIIEGDAGNDTLTFNADVTSLTIAQSSVFEVETLKFLGGHSYTGVAVTGDVASGSGLAIDASAASNISIDLTAATSTAYVVTGSAGDDTIKGNNTGSTYHLEAGGNDTVTGGSGNDTIYMGASLTAADAINGGAGNDIVVLDGDYSAGLTFGATTMTKVETLQLTAGHDYDLTLNALTPSGRFVVDGSGLGAGDSLTVDASASTGPFVTIKGGAGDDILTGTSTHATTFDISHGGDDIVHALGDRDNVNAGGALTAADTIYGDGSTIVNLSGDYSGGLTLGGEISNIAEILISEAGDFNITTTDALVAHGQTFTFNSTSFSFANSFTFDGSAETDGNFSFGLEFKNVDITGGAGNDTISAESRSVDSTYTVHGGAGDDAIEIFYVGPNDFIDGGAGNDALALDAVGSSLGTVSSTQVTGVNALWLSGGSPSGTALTVIGDITGGEGALSIDAGGSLGTYAILLDITAATSSSYSITGGDQASNDFNVGTNITRIDSLSGNIRNDTLEFGGAMAANTTVTLDDVHFQSVETIQIDASTNLVAVDFSGNIASGFGLTVNASAMTAGLTLDFSAATSSGYAVTGGAGNDTVKFGGNFSASDTVNGGGSSDTLELNGDYSAGLTLGATTLTNIETIKVDDGHSYDLVSNDGNVASGATLTVDASALSGSNQLFFDGSNETDGHFAFIGGAGADSLEGGSQSDTFDLSRSDGAFAFGDGGNDTFTVVSAAKFLDDFMDGGTGSDTLVLNGDFSTQTAITGSDVENIETLQLLGGANNYNLIFTDGVTTAITVDASAAASLVFSGAGDTTTAFTITGSAGNDTIAGGNKADTITGGLGADTLTGGGGADVFNYTAVGNSNTATGYDTITDLTTSDFIHIAGETPNFFAAETVNTYQGSLDADLASVLSAMPSFQYAVVTLSGAGDPLSGHTFLVVDGNGAPGYTAGADYVIDITGYSGGASQIEFI